MKTAAELAAFGGAPAFAEPVHVAQLNLPDREQVRRCFRDIFQRRRFTGNGPLVDTLEQAFAERVGVAHAVCVANGTVGLMILARALGLDGEVVVPAFTFAATAQAVSWAGLTPILCDVAGDTHMITAATVRPALTQSTTAILGVHAWGRACEPEALQALAAERGLCLFYDACHAIGCTHRGRPIGGFGRAEVFSFHATKIVNGAEGGCITTGDADLAARLRTMRSCTGAAAEPVAWRLNGGMSEAQAALALVSLQELPRNIAANRQRYEAYRAGLGDVPGLALVGYDAIEANNFEYVVVEIDETRTGLNRDLLFRLLAAENVICRGHFYPGIHRLAPYAGSVSTRAGSFPQTDRLCARVLQLPSGQPVSCAAVGRICDLIRGILAHSEEISARFAAAERGGRLIAHESGYSWYDSDI
ncbi:MAG: aminotransferase class I/II-fold pyridoxal phosphate-dependent enzyme [Alphaproteobacteria bacterium]|nr:aminotransferase class I/II-fold pyridoxal phosphate-dependent enzyme [Alphaproteobacteria bacterium]